MCGPKKGDCGCHRDFLESNPAMLSGTGIGGQAAPSQVYAPVRFVQPQTQVQPTAVPTRYSAAGHVPSMLPGQVMYVQDNVALYRDLYGAVDAYQNPAVAAYPGTWGGHFAAGRAR
jgi:hypothetical protein